MTGDKNSGRKPKLVKAPGATVPVKVLELPSQANSDSGIPYPDDLASHGARLYRELYKLGREDKIFAKLDSPLLIVFCETWARWREAMAELNHSPAVNRSKAGNDTVNPYVWIANALNKTLTKLGSELGCTPVGRAKMALEIDRATAELDEYHRRQRERLSKQ